MLEIIRYFPSYLQGKNKFISFTSNRWQVSPSRKLYNMLDVLPSIYYYSKHANKKIDEIQTCFLLHNLYFVVICRQSSAQSFHKCAWVLYIFQSISHALLFLLYNDMLNITRKGISCNEKNCNLCSSPNNTTLAQN